jgi:DNA-binding NarL/FixJ family response regulator
MIGQKGDFVESHRVLILSEPGLLAQGMRSLLESDPRIEIVGVTADLKRAVEIIREVQPAVILVDADHIRISLGGVQTTIELDWISTLIALSQNGNMAHVCRVEERSLSAAEDLIEAVSV